MSRILVLLAITMATCLRMEAQMVSPPTGNYPIHYGGAAFRGQLVEVSDDGMQFTLRYKRGENQEDFTGRLQQACFNGKNKPPFTMKDFAPQSTITAYYNSITKNLDGNKTRENMVIGLTLESLPNKEIPYEKKRVAFCTSETAFYFRFYGYPPTDPRAR